MTTAQENYEQRFAKKHKKPKKDQQFVIVSKNRINKEGRLLADFYSYLEEGRKR